MEEITKQFEKIFREMLYPQTQHNRLLIKFYTVEPKDLSPTNNEIRTGINKWEN